MTHHDLIAAFETLAEAPDGVKRLRELVLQLAVRGKLVEQNPADGKVANALASIKKQRMKAGGLSADRVQEFGTLAAKDWPFVPPPTWQMLSFGDLFIKVFTGPFGTSLKAHEYRLGGTPVVNPQNLRNGVIVPTEDTCVGPETLTRLQNFLVSERDIVVARRGEMGRCAVVTAREAGWLCGTGSLVLCPPNEVDPRFVTMFLRSPWTVDRLGGDSVGSTMKNLNQKIMANLPFGLPPLAEQHRIVARVDELMSLLDRLEAARTTRDDVRRAARDAALAALRDAEDTEAVEAAWGRIAGQMDALFAEPEDVAPLRQAVLQLAVRGRLVPQDPTDEPADKLLQQLARAREARGDELRQTSASGALGDAVKPFNLPGGWAWCRLTDAGELARGRSRHRPRNDSSLYEGGTVPLVQTGDVARARGTVNTYTALYNEVGVAQSRIWPAGTMCITIAANIADTALLGFSACFPDSVVGFLPFAPIRDAKYFHIYMRNVQSELEAFAPSTAQKNINLAILDDLLLPLPPLREIERIVAKVDALMALCDTFEARLTAARELHAAFAAAAVHHLDV